MGSKGPLITLVGGAALAGVLITLSVHATSGGGQRATPAAGTVAATAPPTPTAGRSPSPSAAAKAATQVIASASAPAVASRATYAGSTTGGAASIAIVVRDGTAIAYVCDGSRVEAWLRGTATGGRLNLTGTHNSRLTGTYGKGVATGEVTVGAKHWTFRVRAVYAPSGLYRATAQVRSAKIEAGWIVIGSRQVGIVTVNGAPGSASTLDTSTRTAQANGGTVTATAVDGTTGSGF
jgi:serine/threonine protein kinase, bacterial